MSEALAGAVSAFPNRLLTLADWEGLPEDETHRLEAAEGILTVTPRPAPAHQEAVLRLGAQLLAGLPDGLTAATDTELLISQTPLTVRAPDLLVVDRAAIASGRARLAPTEVWLAVEILSPGSRRTDRILKLAEYAEAGIEQYWTIDPGPAIPAGRHRAPSQPGADASAAVPVLTAHTLATGHEARTESGAAAYQRIGEYTTSTTLPIAGHPVTIDPGTLASWPAFTDEPPEASP